MGRSVSGEPFAAIAGDLARFEAATSESIGADGAAMADAMRPLFEAGGKRLRPALVFLCGRLGQLRDAHLSAAMAVELVHSATLVHDDLIDSAVLRRGRPTVAHTLGSSQAIVIGDFYFAKAYELAARTGDAAVVAAIAEAVMRICAGELEQDRARYRYTVTELEYTARIEAKTAALLAASCWTGGWLGGLGEAELAALHRYGIELGMAFQIADDVLDYVASADQVGKPVGKDLLEGHATLPLLLSSPDPPLPAGRPLDPNTVARIVEQVRREGGVDRSLERARRHSALARESLAGLGGGPIIDSLVALTDYVVERAS